MLIDPTGKLLQTKTQETLTREDLKLFQDFERMLERRKLAFQLRCRKCNLRDGNDACWGNNQTNASQYVVECACTKRIYHGADVQLH